MTNKYGYKLFSIRVSGIGKVRVRATGNPPGPKPRKESL